MHIFKLKDHMFKIVQGWVVVVYTFNSRTQEAEADGAIVKGWSIE